jgi:four helix bundle suffix protein
MVEISKPPAPNELYELVELFAPIEPNEPDFYLEGVRIDMGPMRRRRRMSGTSFVFCFESVKHSIARLMRATQRRKPIQERSASEEKRVLDSGHRSPPSPPSHSGVIPPHGGYEELRAYVKSQIVYDATVRFCDRFIDAKFRTHDQMVQAARSGNKNIAEGSRISGTSKEAELKLTNVARASLEELLGDYTDYLRQHRHKLWDKNSKEALFVRKLGKNDAVSYEDFHDFIETREASVVANIIICLIHQANYLLDQQLRRLERDFLEQGGLRERMTRARLAVRAQQPRGGS